MQETDAIPPFDTHVCLVSQEAAANLLPATEPSLEPKHVVLVASPEMKGKADHLGQALKESLPSVSIEMVEMTTAYDLTVMLEELFNLFDRLKNQGRKAVVNVTGGTKPMAIAALRSAECADFPCFYLELDRNVVHFLTDEHAIVHLSYAQKPKPYLLAYGFRLQKTPPSALPFTDKLKALAERLVKTPSFRSAYPSINALAAQASKDNSLSVSVQQALSAGAEALLDEFERCGLLAVHGKQIRFASEEARYFVNGGWLEELTADVARATFPNSKVVANAQIEQLVKQKTRSGEKIVRNELDVLFWANDNLCVIECKTSNLKDQGKSQNVIYKLSSFEPRLGKRLVPILVSYLPLDDYAISRARSDGIHVIAGDDLKRLSERLKHFSGGHA